MYRKRPEVSLQLRAGNPVIPLAILLLINYINAAISDFPLAAPRPTLHLRTFEYRHAESILNANHRLKKEIERVLTRLELELPPEVLAGIEAIHTRYPNPCP